MRKMQNAKKSNQSTWRGKTPRKNFSQLNKSKIRLILELSGIPALITDIDFKLKLWNSEAEKLLKKKNVDKIDFDLKVLLNGDFAAQHNDNVVAHLMKYGSWYGIFKSNSKSGAVSKYNVALVLVDGTNQKRILLLFDKDKSINDFEIIFHSIEWTSSLLDSFPYGLYIYNVEKGNAYTLNYFVLNRLGYSFQEAESEIYIDKIDEEISKKLQIKVPGCLDNKSGAFQHNTEIKLKHKDGSWKIFQNSFNTFKKDSNNKPTHLMGFLEEITDSAEIFTTQNYFNDVTKILNGTKILSSGKTVEKDQIMYTNDNYDKNIISEDAQYVSDTLLEGIAGASFQLLTQPNINNAISSAFNIIGRAVNVSCIYIFENYKDSLTNEHLANKIFCWKEDGCAKNLEQPEIKYLSYKKFPGWYSQLSSGSVIKGLVKDFPDSTRIVLESEKILSIITVPIFVNNKFWGIIAFGECKAKRIWTGAEASILVTAANILGNALVRKITEQALIESEEKYRSLFEQAADLIVMIDSRGIIANLNHKVEVETGWKCEELIGKSIESSGLLSKATIDFLTEYFRRGDTNRIFEIDVIRKDGITDPYELNIVPINKNSKLTCIQAVLRNIKERKESEKSLRKSEEKYRKIFENIQDIFYQTDIHGKLTTISPSIERYSGYKPEELIGKPVVTFFAIPKDRAKLMKEMQEKSEIVDYIVKLRNKENRDVFVSVNSHILRNDYGEIIGVEGSLRDVSERVLAYEEIRKLSSAVEQSSNTITITDTSGIIVYVNPKFTVVTGYTQNESIGKNINILKSGRMDVEQYRILWDTILSGKEWKGEFLNKKKNGELFWESASISPVKNENGEITHFLAVKEDITEKKIQEKRLHKYQDLLKGVSESVQILISEKDFHKAIRNALEALGKGSEADRVYIFESAVSTNKKNPLMNLKFEWHREGTPSILNSRYLQNINYSNSILSFYRNVDENKSFNTLTKQLSEEEQAILKPHGILSLLIVPIYVDKQFWGFIGFDDCHNEEVWSESEESILRAAAATIGRAIEREKTNAELIRAKEEAEKAERLKSEFLAQISHEIRSPLNVLLNYSQLFKEFLGDKIDVELFQGFDGMENAGNRIIRTIDLLLNLSELQTGSYNFKSRELDIYSGVIFPLYQEYKKLARGKNLIFNIIRHSDNTKVMGDEYSVTQIFANLIDNAIKYTIEGKIEISIDRNFNNKLFVKVSDTGIGISEYYLPKIYSPFTQEEQGYTRSYEGNGLGLALVKKYCELNKAEIFIDSIKGKGTTFTIVFN